MDFLRNLFGGLTSTIFRLILVVGTMAAVYFFAIRPVLDTTEEISNNATQSFQESFDTTGISNLSEQIQQQVEQSFEVTQQPGGPSTQQLLRCVQRAQQDVQRIQRCAERYGPG